MSSPDFNSYVFNYREQRFLNKKYDIDIDMANNYSSFPIKIGKLSDTNDAVELSNDNKLIIQLFDERHDKGFFVDDFGSLYNRWLRTLREDQYRKDAITCNQVGLLLLDKRAIKNTNNFENSPLERDSPPDKNVILPSLEEWINIWNRANIAS